MTIELKPEQEKIIQDLIQSGRFSSVEEVLDAAFDALKEKIRVRELKTKSVAQLVKESPLYKADLNLERDPDMGRDVIL